MSRIYGKNTDINHDKIRRFFESRFDKDDPLSSVMLRQSADHIAEKRNQHEKTLLMHLLGDVNDLSVLDIGSGMGRWATNLLSQIALYDGIDFTQSYVEASRILFKDYPQIHFYQGLAAEVDQQPLQTSAYQLIIVAGLCVYLNDAEVEKLMTVIGHLLAKGGKLYVRESVSVMDQRLTLKDFHSDELNADYSAIYRTSAQYENIFTSHLQNVKLHASDLMLDKSLGAREETNQRYWFFERQ